MIIKNAMTKKIATILLILSLAFSGLPFGIEIAYAASQDFTTATTGTSFVVPNGVETITVKAWGAGGGSGGGSTSGPGTTGAGGGGGFAQADISVTPGETLTIMVGGGGGAGLYSCGVRNEPYDGGGGGGGGYSAVKRSSTFLVIAGGGGGGGSASTNTGPEDGGPGGGGGGTTGQSGTDGTNNSPDLGKAGTGGTSSAAGSGGDDNTGNPGSSGSGNTGGDGGDGGDGSSACGGAGGTNSGGNGGDSQSAVTRAGGGGGGGGYFGGGGGESGVGEGAGGGGGGSGYVTGTNTTLTQSTGQTEANSTDSDHNTTRGAGGSSVTLDTDGNAGETGQVFLSWSVSTTYIQAAYRWFTNVNSTNVGGAGPMSGAVTAPSAGTVLRLRLLLHVGDKNLAISGQTFNLQYAARGSDNSCDTSFTNETYANITAGTPIRFDTSNSASDGDALTANGNDPRHVGTTTPVSDTVRNQTYEEANTFTNASSLVLAGQDALWDFALAINPTAPPDTTYCLRAVKTGTTTFATYEVIPQITTEQRTKLRVKGQVRLRIVRLY